MSKPKLYTVGYSGRTPEEIASHLTRLGAHLVDVRFKPYSQWQPQWNQASLQNLLGPLYHWFGCWGNRNYKGGSVEIADYAKGLREIKEIGGPCVLMCTCKDAATCHRTVLASMLHADGYEVEELPPVPKKSKKGPSQSLFCF